MRVSPLGGQSSSAFLFRFTDVFVDDTTGNSQSAMSGFLLLAKEVQEGSELVLLEYDGERQDVS